MSADDFSYLTDHGFVWGNVTVTRVARMPQGGRVIGVDAGGGRRLEIYVSPGGRSVRCSTGEPCVS